MLGFSGDTTVSLAGAAYAGPAPKVPAISAAADMVDHNSFFVLFIFALNIHRSGITGYCP
ncbi:hypothetical protein GCM10009596_18970 [Arthrobacter rhombi]